jgi:glycosyltransferase involved in cell wall biosynthesis
MEVVPAIWFLAIKTGTGTDTYTLRLVKHLNESGIKAEITWLPLRAEYAPWSVKIPSPPEWANIIHVNSWLHPRFIPNKLYLVVTVHHSSHDPSLQKYKSKIQRLYHKWWIAPIERCNLQQAHRVVAVSKFVADITRKTLCEVPMQVIYNGVDPDIFVPNNVPRQRSNAFRLLFVGGWSLGKGVDLLPAIMRGLGDEFELFYTGGINANKHKKNMPKNMYDLGRLKEHEIVVAMQNADALLFPTRSEGFGLVVAEAMACGIPVVATALPVFYEILEHGRSGMLVNLDDVDDYIKSARFLASNYSKCKLMGRFAREKVVQSFSISVMTKRYIDLYVELTV